MANKIPFPPVYLIGRLKFVERAAGEIYKAALLVAAAGGNVDAAVQQARNAHADKPIELVPLPQFASELGVSRRTFGRRMAEAAKAASKAEAA